MNVPIFFYLADIVILFVGIPQGQSTFLPHKIQKARFIIWPLFVSVVDAIYQIAHTYQKNEQYRLLQGKRLIALQLALVEFFQGFLKHVPHQ